MVSWYFIPEALVSVIESVDAAFTVEVPIMSNIKVAKKVSSTVLMILTI